MSINIPSFVGTQVVTKDGYFTPVWANIMSQLIEQLQLNYSAEGLTVPDQTASNITLLNTTESANKFLVDSDNDLLKINLGGVFKTIPTIP